MSHFTASEKKTAREPIPCVGRPCSVGSPCIRCILTGVPYHFSPRNVDLSEVMIIVYHVGLEDGKRGEVRDVSRCAVTSEGMYQVGTTTCAQRLREMYLCGVSAGRDSRAITYCSDHMCTLHDVPDTYNMETIIAPTVPTVSAPVTGGVPTGSVPAPPAETPRSE